MLKVPAMGSAKPEETYFLEQLQEIMVGIGVSKMSQRTTKPTIRLVRSAKTQIRLRGFHERMLPTSAGVEPATSWSPVGRRIPLSHRGRPMKLSVETLLYTILFFLYNLFVR